MKFSKADTKTLGGLILNGGINCLAASANIVSGGTASILVELAKAITGNLASNHLAVLSNYSFDKLASRLNNPDPNNVNHDLERLFRQSAVVALEYIKALFLAEIKEDKAWKEPLSRGDRKDFIKGLTLFFDENISDLRNVIKDDHSMPLDKNIIREPGQILDNITEQIFRLTTLSFDPETEQRLKKFYAEKLPYCFELAFHEALKKDDHGFKAFQIWVLKEMQEQNLQLSKGQQKILEAISSMQEGENLIVQQELDGILDKQTEKIYTLLQDDFKEDIKKAFTQIAEEIRQNFERLYKLNLEHYDLTKEILTLLKILLQKFDGRVDNSFPHELNLVPQHRDEFIGREHDLVQLHQQLQASAKVVFVNGIGGIGKTTIAKKYVQLHRHKYDHIAWVEIKTNETGENDIAGRDAFVNAFAYDKTLWANGLRLQFDDTAPAEERFKAIIHGLKNMDGKNLLVIDNAGGEIKEFNEILPVPPKWQVLVTSRCNLAGFTPFQLDKLAKGKAKELFNAWYKTDDEGEVERLLEEIDYHTLMIEMVAKTLEASMGMLTLQVITEKLQTGHLGDMELQETIETSHSKQETELFRHLFITFQIANLSEMEIWVMKQFYFLLPQRYSLKTLILWLKVKTEDEKEFKRSLSKLADKGWLKSAEYTFEMHRLVQQVVYYKLKPGITDAGHLLNTFNELTYSDTHTDITTCFPYLSYAQYIIDKIQECDRADFILGSLLNNLGLMYCAIQQYNEAEKAYMEALTIRKKLSEIDHAVFEPDVAKTLNNLGILYYYIQRYAEAEEAFNEALKIREKLADKNPAAFEPDLAKTLNNLGGLYIHFQRYAVAEKVYKEALVIRRKFSATNHVEFGPDVAMTLENLGGLYRLVQKYDQAENVTMEAVHMYKQFSASDRTAFEPHMARAFDNLGILYSNIQQYGKAEAVYKDALGIRRNLAKINPAAFETDVAMTLNNLGILYSSIHQYSEAENVYQEALTIRKKLAEGNPAAFESDVAATLNNLGILYYAVQQYDAAETVYLEALGIYINLVGRNPAAFEHDKAMTLYNLGSLYYTIGQCEDAKKAYKEAVKLRLKYLHQQSFLWIKVVDLYQALAFCSYALQEKEECLQYLLNEMIILVLFCKEQEEANPYLNLAREIVENYEIDFEQFQNEHVLPASKKFNLNDFINSH